MAVVVGVSVQTVHADPLGAEEPRQRLAVDGDSRLLGEECVGVGGAHGGALYAVLAQGTADSLQRPAAPRGGMVRASLVG